MTVEHVTVEDLRARRAAILAEHPQLASWRPACTRCRSMWCAVTVEGLSAVERGAVRELDVIRSGLGEEWPS